MPGKYLLNINDSGTKEILKAFFTPENAAKIAENLIFKSIEFPENGPGPMVISALIHDLGAAPAFYEIVPGSWVPPAAGRSNTTLSSQKKSTRRMP